MPGLVILVSTKGADAASSAVMLVGNRSGEKINERSRVDLVLDCPF